MLSGPTDPLFACNTEWKCIGGLTPLTHPPTQDPRCVRTKWKAPYGKVALILSRPYFWSDHKVRLYCSAIMDTNSIRSDCPIIY